MSRLDIEKMLTLSTAHITEETSGKLETEPNTDDMSLCVYEKAEYGFFIYIDENVIRRIADNDNAIPEDLRACLKLAIDNDCKVLCLDCDGIEVDELQTYEW